MARAASIRVVQAAGLTALLAAVGAMVSLIARPADRTIAPAARTGGDLSDLLRSICRCSDECGE